MMKIELKKISHAPIPNLSRVLTIVGQHEAAVEFSYHDLAAFHAPSECYPIVDRGNARQHRMIRRRVHGLTGLRFNVAMRRARKLYGDHYIDRAIEHVARLTMIRWGVVR